MILTFDLPVWCLLLKYLVILCGKASGLPISRNVIDRLITLMLPWLVMLLQISYSVEALSLRNPPRTVHCWAGISHIELCDIHVELYTLPVD